MILTTAIQAVPTFVALSGKLSPMPSIHRVVKEGTVGDLPLLPHTTMISTAFLWVAYGKCLLCDLKRIEAEFVHIASLTTPAQCCRLRRSQA